MDTFLKTSEAAKKFGFSELTIRKWARLGYIDAVKVGNRWLIKADTLMQKLQKLQNKEDKNE